MNKLIDRQALRGAPTPQPSHRGAALGHPPADLCLGGLARDALHEVFPFTAAHSAAASAFALALAVRASEGRPLLWVRQDFSAHEYGELYAPGLAALGLDPARLILVRIASPVDVLRVAAEALGSGGLGAVVLEIPGLPKVLDLTASRRLALAAARDCVPAFLLRLEAKPHPSAAETRWIVRAASSLEEDDATLRFEVELARNRHGMTGRWDMEWSCVDGVFREPKNRQASSRSVAAASFDRPHPAPRKASSA